MYLLENELLSVEISAKGAELQSLYHKLNEMQYLWSGDAAFWGKKSPVLFPIVGGLKNNEYSYKGVTYKLGRHGFARDNEFVVTQQTKDSITFSLSSNEITKQIYPFDFVFHQVFTLHNNSLSVSFVVENTGRETMWFSVGAHPAFAVPIDNQLRFEDYYLHFEQQENTGRWPLNENGLLEINEIPFLQNANQLPLTKDLFFGDAIVCKNLKSAQISIQSNISDYKITVDYKGFPYMGIWSAKNANFVCIEPWCGVADSVDATGLLEEKEGINQLAAGNKFEATYSVNVF